MLSRLHHALGDACTQCKFLPGILTLILSCAVAPDKMPWGTHAYIVSSRQAERMALTADMMIQRSKRPVDDFHTTSWQLDGEDIKIDHYLSMYYSDLTPQDDKRRCNPW